MFAGPHKSQRPITLNQNLSLESLNRKNSKLSFFGSQLVSKLVPKNINSITKKSRLENKSMPSFPSNLSFTRVPNIDFEETEKPQYNLNPIYTSKKEHTPPELIKATFAVYRVGEGLDSAAKTYGRPSGLGFVLNENLCMTAHSVIPDETTAINSFLQFRDGEVFKLDPYRCFFTSSKLMFTLVAFGGSSSRYTRHIKPISIAEPFELRTNDSVNFFPHDYYQTKRVVIIDKNKFTFTSGNKESILPGTPVFSSNWTTQGMYTCSSSHLNIVARLEPILNCLDSSLSMLYNSLLEHFLHKDKLGYMEKFHGRFVYFFLWHTQNIWRYDIDKQTWNHVTIRNSTEFRESWNFHWNSRVVYLPDTSVLILGGRDKHLGETNEVWAFCPAKHNTLEKMPSMLQPRESGVFVLVDNYVYALGGKPYAYSCERMSIKSKFWEAIADMHYPRHDSAACTALESRYIFVLGGHPLNTSGTTIEKYSIQFNRWELLNVRMPRPLAKLSVFPISNKRIAILGGSGSHWVFTLRMEDNLDFGGTQNFYSVEDCMRPLDEITESVYPVAFCRNYNKLFILNLARTSYNKVTPGIAEYPVEYFDLTTHVDYSAKPLELKTQTPFSTEHNSILTRYL